MSTHITRRDKLRAWVIKYRIDLGILAVLLVVSGLVHGHNIFHFPYYENDEATYISQAWAFLTHGRLAPYTYWYDHAPAGWMFLALWQGITGGTKLFGGLFQDGRAFMLVLHLASAAMIYFITLKISKSRLAAVIAILFFSLSPLGLYFQRRVLLDNIIVFWLFASVSLLLLRYRIKWVVLSGLCFGIAVLSKETAIVALPALGYLLYLQSPGHRKWAFSQWLGVIASVVVIYLLYAFLKDELFPSGTWLGGYAPHVSLLGSLQTQSSRGEFFFPWQSQSAFYQNASEWIWRDPLLMLAGAVGLIGCILLGIRRRMYLVIAIIGISYILFFARGKLLIDFYIVPLLPWLAISVGVCASYIVRVLRVWPLKRVAEIAACLAIILFYAPRLHDTFTRDETANQFAAINWIQANVPSNAAIAIDDYAFPTLQQENTYVNADWFYKIEDDPAIQAKYHNDWRNLGYILLSHDMLQGIRNYQAPYMKQALDHATPIATFTNNTLSYIKLSKYISTYGDWAMVYKIKNREDIATQDNWVTDKTRFFMEYGRIIPSAGATTSTLDLETQFMTRALTENDSGAFSGIANWSADHLEHRPSDKLLSNSYTMVTPQPVVDPGADIPANVKYAALLLEGAKKFNNPTYTVRAMGIMNDIWTTSVKQIAGTLYITNASGAVPILGLTDPTSLKAFEAADPTHNWTSILDSQYSLVKTVQAQSPAGLINPGAMLLPSGKLDASTTPTTQMTFGVVHQIVEDAITTRDPRATAILAAMKTTLDATPRFADQYAAAMAVDVYTALGSARATEVYQSSASVTYNEYSHMYGKTTDALFQIAMGLVFTDASSVNTPLMLRDK